MKNLIKITLFLFAILLLSGSVSYAQCGPYGCNPYGGGYSQPPRYYSAPPQYSRPAPRTQGGRGPLILRPGDSDPSPRNYGYQRPSPQPYRQPQPHYQPAPQPYGYVPPAIPVCPPTHRIEFQRYPGLDPEFNGGPAMPIYDPIFDFFTGR